MTGQNGTNEIRRTFIAMLFALVVATLANRFADILFLATQGWSILIFSPTFFESLFENEWQLLAPFTHALLGLLLVSMSWVGWSRSLSAGHQLPIEKILSVPFLLLLIEVMLVTLYFGIAVSIELHVKPDLLSTYNENINTGKASALPETIQLISVYFVYLIWDFLSDIYSSPLKANNSYHVQPWQKNINWASGLATYGFSSILCILLCLLIYSIFPNDANAIQTVIADFALVSVLAIFHSSKCLEPTIIGFFPWEGTRKNSVRKLTTESIIKLLVSLSSFIFFVILLIWN